jgi:hypothetical protein
MVVVNGSSRRRAASTSPRSRSAIWASSRCRTGGGALLAALQAVLPATDHDLGDGAVVIIGDQDARSPRTASWSRCAAGAC